MADKRDLDKPELFDDLFEPFDLDEPPEPEPLSAPPPPPPPRPRMEEPAAVPETTCPSCGASNPATLRHCEECGARLAQGPLPVAAQPLIRNTAGARALIVLAAVVAVVALAALLWGVIRDDGETSPDDTAAGDGTTTSVTQAAPTDEAVLLRATEVRASSQLSAYPATNLIDDDPSTEWQDNAQRGVGAALEFLFEPGVALERIEIVGLPDPVRFKRNFRVNGYRLRIDDLPEPIVGSLADTQEVQTIEIETDNSTSVRLEVTSTYPAEAVGPQQPFNELAIQEIRFYGRPVG